MFQKSDIRFQVLPLSWLHRRQKRRGTIRLIPPPEKKGIAVKISVVEMGKNQTLVIILLSIDHNSRWKSGNEIRLKYRKTVLGHSPLLIYRHIGVWTAIKTFITRSLSSYLAQRAMGLLLKMKLMAGCMNIPVICILKCRLRSVSIHYIHVRLFEVAFTVAIVYKTHFLLLLAQTVYGKPWSHKPNFKNPGLLNFIYFTDGKLNHLQN